MPRHVDAIGYLNDLAGDVNKPWFTMVCDLAALCGKSTLDKQDIDTLHAIFLGQATYLRITSPVSVGATSSATSHATTDYLETLSGFTNFKRLEDTLQVNFTKRITIIFGANGSGKSSLCKSLKVLANPERPTRPIHNVLRGETPTPKFNYKFRSDSAMQTWTTTIGFGPKSSTVKYFDIGIALKNVKSAMEPGRVIELSPFKLNVFERVKALITQFRDSLQSVQSDNASKLKNDLERIHTQFGKFNGRPLASIDEKSVGNLEAEIKQGESFTDQDELERKLAAATELEKATSEDGLKMLKAESRELETFLTELTALLDAAEGLWAINPVEKAKELDSKHNAQEVLAKALIPEGATLESLLSLIRSASSICNLEEAEHKSCPLCRRDLHAPEITLFKKYHELLAGDLEKDITKLRKDLEKAEEFSKKITNIDPSQWDKSFTLSKEIPTIAKPGAVHIKKNCGLKVERPPDAGTTLDALKALRDKGTETLEQKTKAIEAAEKDRGELLKQLMKLRVEIEPVDYAKAISARVGELKETELKAKEAAYWNAILSTFPPLLKKITDAAKKSHEELVVSDFECRLNAEYKALTEKDMTAFGVKLKNIGGDATVTISSKIGGREIEDVLSEGEQRVHALALFFAELETCSESVLVFDDPISSFDYNYIANYCSRLRDFALNHPTRQIIVLTHNWEFFIQLQTALNTGGLNNYYTVQILENQAVVADYSEKLDELKRDINAILSIPSEPTRAQKEEMAGKMRRLIETVVNTHVFNNQRHQYKQKSQSVSEFQHFTKLVSLLPAEATTLRDLYAKLSITEHDDPRNAYVNTDKAMFKTRYDSIVAVENAIISRKLL